MLTLLLAAALAFSGCEKEVEDETGPTTGEVEVEEDEVEVEAEKELPEDEAAATGEGAVDPAYGWLEIEMDDADIDGATDYVVVEELDPGAEGLALPEPEKAVVVTDIYANPVDHIGTTVYGEARVKKLMSDRGFWVESGGERIFAVLREDRPQGDMIDLEEGQKLKFTGLLVDGDDWKMLEGELSPETKATLKEQDAFLTVYWDHIKIADTNEKSAN